jgi:GT2 family glycosyltransferase
VACLMQVNNLMARSESYKLAVLVTCYNRRDKTLPFLDSLISQPAFSRLHPDIYLMDDGSTDGTAAAVKDKYPQVNVVTGTGSLFWAGGMLAIWKHAIAQQPYDMFLLLNDDVLLFPDSLERLLNCYSGLSDNGTVLIGSTLSAVTHKISYGGHALYRPDHANYYLLKPDEQEPVSCQLANANIFLVDAKTVAKIGLFSDAYTHYLADFDYSITAHRAGLGVWVAPGYYGYCEDDHGVNWLPGSYSLKERIKYLYSPKGLAYKEYLIYIKKHFPADYVSALSKLWLKTLFPVIWDKFKRREVK